MTVKTKGVTRLGFTRSPFNPIWLTLDGEKFTVKNDDATADTLQVDRFEKKDGKWQPLTNWTADLNALKPGDPLLKRPGLQGPIDDAFLEPFLVVAPTGKSTNPMVERWAKFELDHLVDRWRAVFRGELRIKNDVDVTDEDLAKYHVVCWGDFTSNKLLAKMQDKLPLQWSDKKLSFRDKAYDAASHVPVLIYPNPLRPGKYVVVNSGPTFREFDDNNNSLQNPKLGDWAVIDLREPPNNRWPGKIAAAGFFDEEWK